MMQLDKEDYMATVNDILSCAAKEVGVVEKVNNNDKYNWSLYVHIIPKELTGLSHDKYYVGITGREPQKRWLSNGHGYQGKAKDIFWNDIKKYGWKNIIHKVILTGLTEEHALEMERLYIQVFRSNNPEYGYNGNCGGFGGNVKPLVPVIQYDLDGNFIKRWESGAEAARAIGVDLGRITAATKNNSTVKGYQFKRADAPAPGKYQKRTGFVSTGPRPQCRGENNVSSKKVVLLNTGEIFVSIRDACKKTGANINTVSKCCIRKKGSSGRDHNRKRLVWRFYQDYAVMSQNEIKDIVEQAQHPNHWKGERHDYG